MDMLLRKHLINIATEQLRNNDPAHDIYHAIRVLNNAEVICNKEGGDLDIIIPAALFHDSVCYAKDDPRSKYSVNESAKLTASILKEIEEYPIGKIEKVYIAIEQCSFSKKISPDLLEAKILQDADRLEATGAISIMRTFSSAGQMKSKLYNFDDPFCENREPDGLKYAIDLFYLRLLKVKDLMHTETGKSIAKKRSIILEEFLKSLREEVS